MNPQTLVSLPAQLVVLTGHSPVFRALAVWETVAGGLSCLSP